MSNSQRKRDAVKRQLKREQPPSKLGDRVNAGFVTPDIHREVRYITQLAQAEDSRIVTVGNLVLFSTRARDAWLLDPEDDFAVCVCRDGEPQAFRIIDAA